MDNLWTRRSNNTRLSLSAGYTTPDRNSPFNNSNKRFGDSTKSPFTATTPGGGLPSPNVATNAFALGSGAFASFGSGKTPKSTSAPAPNPFDIAAESESKASNDPKIESKSSPTTNTEPSEAAKSTPPTSRHPLKHKWVFWFRPPVAKSQGFVDYEKTLHPMAECESLEEFIEIYTHLKHVSKLPVVSEYHFFKSGIRPIWEDDENKKGGKWVVRLKKGVVDRFWENLLLALVGDKFGATGDEVCGAVVSVRNGEDIISIWTRTASDDVSQIRDSIKEAFESPADLRIEFKSHDASIQQRTAIEESRREKAFHKSQTRAAPIDEQRL